MKTKVFLIGLFLIAGSFFPACSFGNKPSDKKEKVSEGNIEVYYFHYTRRCATCQAVEDESIKALKELYPEAMENGTIVFLVLNLEVEKNQEIAEGLDVDGQTLLIVKGDERKNLTTTAFMNVRSNPEKLKKAFEEFIGTI